MIASCRDLKAVFCAYKKQLIDNQRNVTYPATDSKHHLVFGDSISVCDP